MVKSMFIVLLVFITLSGSNIYAQTDYQEITLDDIYRKG